MHAIPSRRPSPPLVFLALILVSSPGPPRASAEGWRAGASREAITPRGPIWMAGYSARTRPSEGALHDLWARALVLEDPDGRRCALVSLDVCGIARPLSVAIRDRLKDRYGLDRDRVALACSHTHSGPVVGTNLITMYPLDDAQRRLIEAYADRLRDAVVAVVGRAVAALGPATVAWETGRADFAVNRRENKEADVEALRGRLALKGPVDHDVPVLRVLGADGRPRALVFGYACHCTVLDGYQLSGDYAGFAQDDLERAHPGAVALFVAGCGADQNPLPRRSVALARDYGAQLARAVEHVLAMPMNRVEGRLRTAYEEIDLAFADVPGRDHWEQEARSADLPVANRARRLLERIDAEGRLPTTYPYPVQVWGLGDELTWVLLGGEVVVDYALRLKRNLGSSRTWVSGYCNDVMAYIPSLRVLKEGGYEGATAMIYYGLPTPWSDRVEEAIIGAVGRLVDAGRPEHRPERSPSPRETR